MGWLEDQIGTQAQRTNGGWLQNEIQGAGWLQNEIARQSGDEGFWEDIMRRMGQGGMGIINALSRIAPGVATVGPLQSAGRRLAPIEAEEVAQAPEQMREGMEQILRGVAPADQRPFRERFADNPLRAGAGAVAQTLPGLGLAAATGGAAGPGAFTAAFATTAGSTGALTSGMGVYDSLIAEGVDESTALTAGAGVGVLSGLLDMFGGYGLAKPLKSAAAKELRDRIAKGQTDKILREILMGGVRETGTEFGQELVYAAGEILGGRPADDVFAELDDRLLESTIGAAGVSLGVGGTSAGLARRRGRQRLTNEQRSGSNLEQVKGLLERVEALPPEQRRALLAGELSKMIDWSPESHPVHHTQDELQALVVADKAQPLKDPTIRYAELIAPEIATITAVEKVLGKDVALEMEDGFSHSRVGVARVMSLLESPVMGIDGRQLVPALTDILAESKGKGFDADPDPEFLRQWMGEEQWGDLRKVWKIDPGLRYVEEVSWIERMKALAQREQEQIAGDQAAKAARKAQLGSMMDAGQMRGLGLQVESQRTIFTDPKALKKLADREAQLRRSPHYDTWARTARMRSIWQSTEVSLAHAAGWIDSGRRDAILQHADTYAPISRIPKEQAAVELESHGGIDQDDFFPAIEHGLPADIIQRDSKGNPVLGKDGREVTEPLWSPTVAGIRRMQQMLPLAYRQMNLNEFYRLVTETPEARERFAEMGIHVGDRPADLPPIPGARKGEGDDAYVKVEAWTDGESHQMWMPKIYAESLGYRSPLTASLQNSIIGKIAGTLTSLKRATAIFTPRFAMTTAVRDQFEAQLISRYGYRAFEDMARGAFHLFTHSPEAQDAKAQGIGIGSIVSTEINRARGQYGDVAIRMAAKDAESMLEVIGWKMRRIGRAWKTEVRDTDIEHQPAALLYPLARMTEGIDMASRLGAYLRARDAGATHAQSLTEQRRTNIDFLRKPGGIPGQLGRAYAFFNPLAQSFDLNIKALIRSPLAAARTITGLLLVPELIHFMINYDNDEYQNLEEWEKRRYYFWHQTDGGDWIRTPRPLGVVASAFGYAFGEGLRHSYRADPGTASRVLGALQDETPGLNLLPVLELLNTRESHQRRWSKFGLAATPEQLLPIVEQMANRNLFFDSPIVPEWMTDRPPHERAYRTAPEVYKRIARFFPESSSLAQPLQVEYWSRTAGGSVLSTAFKAGELGRKLAAGEELGDEVPLHRVPGIDAFVSRRKDAGNTAPVQRLFELVERDRWLGSKKNMRGASPELRARARTYRRLEKELKRVRKKIELRNTADENFNFAYRDRLDGEIVDIAERALMSIGDRGRPGEGPAGPFWEALFGGQR